MLLDWLALLLDYTTQMDEQTDAEALLEPPKNCTVCGAKVTRWNAQHLCKTCGASWILVRNAKAENLAMFWFFGAVGLLAFVPLTIGLIHLGIATVGCGFLAVRLKREHRYQLITAPEGGAAQPAGSQDKEAVGLRGIARHLAATGFEVVGVANRLGHDLHSRLPLLR